MCSLFIFTEKIVHTPFPDNLTRKQVFFFSEPPQPPSRAGHGGGSPDCHTYNKTKCLNKNNVDKAPADSFHICSHFGLGIEIGVPGFANLLIPGQNQGLCGCQAGHQLLWGL